MLPEVPEIALSLEDPEDETSEELLPEFEDEPVLLELPLVVPEVVEELFEEEFPEVEPEEGLELPVIISASSSEKLSFQRSSSSSLSIGLSSNSSLL